MSGGNEGTEPPTEHKLQEARKKGDTPQSRELSHAIATLCWSLVLMAMASTAMAFFARFVEVLLAVIFSAEHRMTLGWAGLHLALGIAPVCLIGLCAALLPELLQSRGRWASKRKVFDVQRLNPVQRMKSLFSLGQLMQVPLAVVRLMVVAVVGWKLFAMMLPIVQRDGILIWYGTYQVAWWGALKVLSVSSAICLGLGMVDAFIQNKLWLKRNRMKKDEIQREHKDQEGDPVMKGQRRQAHQESVRQ